MSDILQKYVRVGALTGSITIEKNVRTKDVMHAVVDVWQTVATRRAGIEHLYGKEFIEANTRFSQSTTIIFVRYDDVVKNVNTSHRIIYKGEVHDIKGTDQYPMDRPRFKVFYTMSRDEGETNA